MGTTLAAVAITVDTGSVVVHVGDSRLYRLRHGRLMQLTQDHTVITDLMSAGELNEEDAKTHPHRYVLTRALGVGPEVLIDYAGVSGESGDRLLLCTDGVFKALSTDEVKGRLGIRE